MWTIPIQTTTEARYASHINTEGAQFVAGLPPTSTIHDLQLLRPQTFAFSTLKF